MECDGYFLINFDIIVEFVDVMDDVDFDVEFGGLIWVDFECNIDSCYK